MNKKIFKVLVVDDDNGRNETYLQVLSNKFSVEIINDITEVTKKKMMEVDMLVIDVCLGISSLTAFKFLEDFNLKLPTVLVSSQWVDENGEPNKFILQVPNYKNIIKVVSWNDFNREDSNQRISEEIYYEFCKVRNIELDSNSDECTILQISDLQFGGNESGAAINDDYRIASYLRDNEIIPNIVVITGDIADKAEKEEYQLAKKWIEQLAKELWDIDGDIKYSDRQKVIIVPGNHDYDVSICAADIYKYKFGADEKDTFIKKDNPDFKGHQSQGFNNFIEFASKMTDDDSWFHYMDKAIHYNERFLNYGIGIITLNSVYGINSRNCENKFDGNYYCDISSISEEKLKTPKLTNDVINIMVMHNPPSDFRKGTNSGEKSWNRFQTLIQDNKVNICLYGHTHDAGLPFQLRDTGGDYCKNLICIPAPSLRLAASARTEDAGRGFNILKLKKQDGKYDSLTVESYEMKKAAINLIEEETFSL